MLDGCKVGGAVAIDGRGWLRGEAGKVDGAGQAVAVLLITITVSALSVLRCAAYTASLS